MFPVRYELTFYILITTNSVSRGLGNVSVLHVRAMIEGVHCRTSVSKCAPITTLKHLWRYETKVIIERAAEEALLTYESDRRNDQTI
jgi:hypothetical protein